MRIFWRHFLLAGFFCAALTMPVAAAPLLLELWRNGATDHTLVHVTLRDGAPLLAAADFARLGIKVTQPPGDVIDLARLPGVSVSLDEAGQRLLLTLPAQFLPSQLYDLGAGASGAAATASERGAILRYDLSATAGDMRHAGRNLSGGVNAGLDLFGDFARFSNSGFATWGLGGRAVRLDSALTFDQPATLTHLNLGDAITVTPGFGRALRFGGVELASDFALAPGLVTTPLPSFFGVSDVPATIDVYNGAARMAQQDIAPGPFEIRNLPIVTGGGAATVVVRDVLGRETAQSLSLFTDKGLLSPGLDAFAVDLGLRRRNYGFGSFDYDMPLLSGDWRRGLSRALTVEAHGEAASELALLGGGAEWGFGRGTVSAGINISQSGQGAGYLAALSGQIRSGWFNLYGSGQIAGHGYRDLAAMDGVLPPRWRLQAGASADLSGMGALTLSWIGEKPFATSKISLLSASWSLPLPRGLFLTATGLRDFSSGAVSAQLSLAIPLGGHGLASATAQSDNGRLSGLMLIDNPASPDGGAGYRFAYGGGRTVQAQAQASYVGAHAGLDGGIALANGAPAIRADMAGALVLLRGSVFAVHDPGEAVALVETGQPGIRIYRENREVAVSDDDGRALLTGLVPYAPNHVAIEPRDYPFTALVEKTDLELAPPRRGAAVADLRPASRHPLLAMVTRGIDMAIPPGSVVRFDGDDAPVPLGHDGRLFIADMKADARRGAVIDTGTSHCRVFITADSAKGALPQTPPLLCLREASGAY